MEMTDKQKGISGFVWSEEKEEGVLELEGHEFAKAIDNCATLLLQQLLSSMSHGQYDGEEIIVPIAGDMHPLMMECLSEKYTDESKGNVFALIQDVFFAKAMQSKKRIEEKINVEVMPVTQEHKNRYVLVNLGIHDNLEEMECPMSDSLSDESANRVMNDLMNLKLTKDHTREDAPIQGKDFAFCPVQVEIEIDVVENPDYKP